MVGSTSATLSCVRVRTRIAAGYPDAEAVEVHPPSGVMVVALLGRTDVTMTLDAQLSGLKGLLMGRPVQKSMDSEVAGLDKAKAVLVSRR